MMDTQNRGAPYKPEDRGLLLDKMFRKMPRNSGGGWYDFGGGGTQYGLNYGTADEWGGDANGFRIGNAPGSSYNGYSGPYAGPPLIIQVQNPVMMPPNAKPATTSKTTKKPESTTAGEGGDDETTTEGDEESESSTDSESSTGGGSTESPSSTMSPYAKNLALVRAFGGGERPRIQQMGPPIIIPMNSVNLPGLRGLDQLQAAPQKAPNGKTPPFYGKIVLGPPKFASAWDGSPRNSKKGQKGQNSFFTILQQQQRGMSGGQGDCCAQLMGGGQRSIQQQPQRQQPQTPQSGQPPVIRYVPVIEYVKRRRMKGILAEPVDRDSPVYGPPSGY